MTKVHNSFGNSGVHGFGEKIETKRRARVIDWVVTIHTGARLLYCILVPSPEGAGWGEAVNTEDSQPSGGWGEHRALEINLGEMHR